MSTDTTQIWARHADHHINHHDPQLLAQIIHDAMRATSHTDTGDAPG